MSIDKNTVKKLAALAKLEFDEAGEISIQNDLTKMLNFINKLNEIDTENVEPLVYLLDEKPILREDVVIQTITQKEALKNAPNKDTDFFKVPKVIKR